METLIVRLSGLLLFKHLSPEIAYLINTTLFDFTDSITLDPMYTKTYEYHFNDKIADNMLRLVALRHKPTRELMILYILRTIGEIMFFTTKDRRYLFYFPDFFQIWFLQDLLPKNLQLPGVTLGLIAKFIAEYYQHYCYLRLSDLIS